MQYEGILQEIGLSKGEVKVYLALLKLGSVPVSKIKEETGLHRTTIYDFVEKLINKGLVNFVLRHNVKYYKATNPNKLLDLIKEKQENIQEILPDLIKLTHFKKEDISVEVHRGKEGFKTLLNDILKVGESYVAFGIDESKFKEYFDPLIKSQIKKEEKKGIHQRLLSSEEATYTYEGKFIHYKYIPEEFFNPTSIQVYGNRVATLIWEPLTIIIIKNPQLADAYKKHFEMLWKIAKQK